MNRRAMNRSGFFLTMLVIVAGVAFGILSIDRGSVSQVSVAGDLNDQQFQAVATILTGAIQAGGRFRASSVDELKDMLDAIDWIHHTNVKKDWPKGLIVEIFPEQVIAYWNDDSFISEEGKVLVTDLFVGGDLPYLYGPIGTEYEVMTRYQQMSRTLYGTGDRVEALTMNDRGSWEFETRGRLRVMLGKEDVRQRLSRVLRVSNRLRSTGDLGRVERMDARYSNGIAVQFRTDIAGEVLVAGFKGDAGGDAYE